MSDPSDKGDIRRNNETSDAGLPPSKSAAPNEGSHKLAIKDLLSLTFSAIALIVAGLTYYTSNIRIVDDAMARIVDFDTTQDGAWIVAHIVYINAGNRPAIVINTGYMLRGSKDDPLRTIEFGGNATTAQHTLPLVLPPHEVRVVDLRIPISDLVNNYEHGTPVPTERSPSHRSTDREFIIRLTFDTLDSKGAEHNAWSEDQGPTGVSNSGWVFGPAPNRALISLLTEPGKH